MSNIKNLLVFLLEQHEPSPDYVLYWDCDGTLADFESGFNTNPEYIRRNAELSKMTKEMFGKEMSREELKPMFAGYQKDPQMKALKKLFYLAEEHLYDLVKQEGFFANLEVMPSAKRMFAKANAMVSTIPIILTAPMDSTFCEPEKRQWVAEHFGVPDSNIIVDKEKFKWAAPNHILIDDRMKSIGPWRAADGIGILHTSPEDTLKQLEEIIYGASK